MLKGTKGAGDSKPRDIFSRMGQGAMKTKKLVHGLFAQMGQTAMKGSPGHPRPGKTAPSIARRMGQGGK